MKRPAGSRSYKMKIQVIKKGTPKAKPSGYCVSLIDDFPMAKTR